ncbi:hypothetical protein A2415_00735 [candidate division WWE3 bacterium RIFOXYC1_FULL_39_7]|uniref:NAD-dependent epimerase/dehydratase domain-containing protein n=2 Tax=Katanobacteria TaxID=422282 RepID=A0A1F4X6K2_UNCKA|nr:MAG: hypothetical protein A2415_00735 [candidate division WWE3 bacterium RIFOXYC1_FULL_39_7]OGC77330.1 MAG: hypothetical protein A2619_04820 [candidate division WWE3 bacterium RIFOXYD1_FULL_39_9]
MTKSPSRIVTEDVEYIVKVLAKKLDVLEGTTVLVTGASGLFGSYFLDVIAYLNETTFKKNCRVIAIQRSDPSKTAKLKYLTDRKDITFVKHDARYPYEPETKIDYFVHSAGMSAPAFFQADPLGTVDINVNGIRWVLEAAKKDASTSVLYMSSGEIYGHPTPENIPIKETYNGNVSSLDLRACYAESKRLSETLCATYKREYEVPVKIARSFATYGPGLTTNDRRVIADFIRNGIEGKPIEMLSDGSDTRVFCYISDATIAFFEILLSQFNGEAFNVSNDLGAVRILDLANYIHEICDIKEPVKIKTREKADFIKDAPTVVMPDISKIKTYFNFEPKIDIKEGLRRTIEWNKEILKV